MIDDPKEAEWRVDRKTTRMGSMSDQPAHDFVPGTPGSRVAMVWPLTEEVVSLSRQFDAQQRLRRDVVVLRRGGS